MALNTLSLAATMTFVAAVTYTYVGLRLLDRKALTTPSGKAMGMFSLWWLATALNQYGGSSLYMAASLGWTDLDVQVTYVVLQRLLLSLSLVGLMHYLLYVFRGRDYLVPLLAFYTVYAALQIYSVLAGRPDGVMVGAWRTDLHYEVEVSPFFTLSNLVFIVIPPVAGSLALWRLYRRVETRSQRLRIAVVSIGFVAWWVFAVFAGQRPLFENDAVQVVNRVLGLSVAVAILLAYEPTAWMRRRFRLETYRAAAQ